MRVSDFFGIAYVVSGLIGLSWLLVLGLNAVGLTKIMMWPSIFIVATALMFGSKMAARYFYRKAL
jgi:hypothetical protein